MDLEEPIRSLRSPGSDHDGDRREAASSQVGLPASFTPTLSAFLNMPCGGLMSREPGLGCELGQFGFPGADVVRGEPLSYGRFFARIASRRW